MKLKKQTLIDALTKWKLDVGVVEKIADAQESLVKADPSDLLKGRYHERQIGVGIIKLARSFGLKLFRADFSNDNISSICKTVERSPFPEVSDKIGYQITVSKSSSDYRSRYSYAHGLAHFLLHKELIDDKLINNIIYRSQLNNAQETKAVKLANDILMPMPVLEVLTNLPNSNLYMVADIFQVSQGMITTRLGIPDYSGYYA